MHAKIKNNSIIEYPIINIRQNLSNVSLPEDLTNDNNLPEGYVYVNTSDIPSYDIKTQKIAEDTPKFVDNKWCRNYIVVDKSAEELQEYLDQHNLNAKSSRQYCYQTESDPLFFKAQRAECTMDEWRAKVLEIQQRYPLMTND